MRLKGLNIWFGDSKDYFTGSVSDARVGAHLAGITAHAWGGELDPSGYVPAFRVAGVQRQAAADGGHAIAAGGGLQL